MQTSFAAISDKPYMSWLLKTLAVLFQDPEFSVAQLGSIFTFMVVISLDFRA